MSENIKKTILVVEDETPLRTAISGILSSEGFTVFEASNGQEGLDCARKEHPDLILLDQMMPVMDGLMVLEKLREDEGWGKSVKVVFLTNSSDDNNVSKATEGGVSYFLIKSDWDIADVVKKIKEQLNL